MFQAPPGMWEPVPSTLYRTAITAVSAFCPVEELSQQMVIAAALGLVSVQNWQVLNEAGLTPEVFLI